ncbi:acetolactate synthase small subunit [Rhodothalassium salexigens DSM 2132]|uniref:Acetolactate synthase small subunit n=1 Tax=Rhodothalassium salexigens DSM 2132 TaxID=1188247 RepID=A0A4R2PGZ0_RHOSA|nr:hypothetical protein [Rhodothalassium salexigens]MBB4211808.1 acetolactate synthase regulatory subunit [Rhodothalassium salexigens DSM 2132]MBK1638143.1 hypothetical protein [Rhodothalassium salexigens DSM 2132]TCP33894.1 acetolactate synthase small subunit [Rhodothalassium salexigens DSM 2132]
MRETLTLHLDDSHGALLRTLGLIERRGWKVTHLDLRPAEPAGQTARFEVERLPWHAGTPEILARHVSKLFCVADVTLGTEAARADRSDRAEPTDSRRSPGWTPPSAPLSAAGPTPSSMRAAVGAAS